MSDLHRMPLTGHDMPHPPVVRATVYKRYGAGWGWAFIGPRVHDSHGPFETWREAYDSARRMCEQL
jgi:hypothetical protein